MYARRCSFDVVSQASTRDADPHPSAVEYALGALGADLVCGLQREAAARHLPVHAVEAALSGRMNNVLVHIGVIGEEGHAGFEAIEGTVYVETDSREADMRAAWQAALEKSPLFTTIGRAAAVNITLQVGG